MTDPRVAKKDLNYRFDNKPESVRCRRCRWRIEFMDAEGKFRLQCRAIGFKPDNREADVDGAFTCRRAE